MGKSAIPQQPSHRERLIAAMAASIEEKGYRDTFVGDVVRIARTSRRTYYEHFKDRDACFLALFDACNDDVIERITAAVEPERPWEEQVDAALWAYLEAVVERPALWQSFARELPALGREGAARQHATIARFAELLVQLAPVTMDTAIMIVGGMRELIVSAAEQGRDVRKLQPVAAQTIKAILGAALLEAPR